MGLFSEGIKEENLFSTFLFRGAVGCEKALVLALKL